jgi:hypothetical protein
MPEEGFGGIVFIDASRNIFLKFFCIDTIPK